VCLVVLDRHLVFLASDGGWQAVTEKLHAKVLAMVAGDDTVEEHGSMHHTCSVECCKGGEHTSFRNG